MLLYCFCSGGTGSVVDERGLTGCQQLRDCFSKAQLLQRRAAQKDCLGYNCYSPSGKSVGQIFRKKGNGERRKSPHLRQNQSSISLKDKTSLKLQKRERGKKCLSRIRPVVAITSVKCAFYTSTSTLNTLSWAATEVQFHPVTLPNEGSLTLPPASPNPATGRLYDQPANCFCTVCDSIGPSTYESVGASEVNSRSKFAVSS